MLRNIFKKIRRKTAGAKLNFNDRMVTVSAYYLNLLETAAWQRGERKEAQDKIKAYRAWELSNTKNK